MQEEKKVLLELSDEELESVVGGRKKDHCCKDGFDIAVVSTITALITTIFNLGGGGGGGAGGQNVAG
jgi:bacteriocin-like protein